MDPAEAVVSVETGPVAALVPERADLIARSVRSGRRFVLASSGGTRLTEPLRQVLTEVGGTWAVDEDGAIRDGLTGRLLDPDDGTPGEVAAAHLRPGPLEPALLLTLTLRHPAGHVRIGAALDALLAAIGLPTPGGWGTAEPAARAWPPPTLPTTRGPLPRLSVAGAPGHAVEGCLVLGRTSRHVEETVQVLAGAAAATLERVPEALAGLAESGPLPLFGLVWERLGRADLTTPPHVQAPPLPVALLLGAPAVRRLELDPAALAKAVGGRLAGRPRLPALVVPLDRDLGRLVEVTETIGEDRIARAAAAPR